MNNAYRLTSINSFFKSKANFMSNLYLFEGILIARNKNKPAIFIYHFYSTRKTILDNFTKCLFCLLPYE